MDRGEPTLMELINDYKGSRSFRDLAADSEIGVQWVRFQQLASRDLKNFPDPKTLLGVSQALSLPMDEVVLATARSVGLPIRRADPANLTIAGAGDLPKEARALVLEFARDLMALHSGKQGRHAAAPAPVPAPATRTELFSDIA